jgi:glycosyltransferase involved in cell wall biosynthesis
VRIAVDSTPLLGPRTGIGRYVASLTQHLARPAGTAPADELLGIAFTARGHRDLPASLPPGARAVGPPAPARLLHKAWARSEWPPVTLLTGRVDVFHGTNFVLPPTGRAAGVVTVHDLSYLRLPGTVSAASRSYQQLVPRSVRRAQVVLTPSQAVADELSETYDLAPDRIVVTHLGVDPEWSSAGPPDAVLRGQLALPERWFVFVGNLEPRKNLPVLVDAYRALLAERPDAPGLVLVGPPGWGPALDLRGIPARNVVFTGYRTDGELRSLVAGSTALVYPTAYEGFGLPPLEAFAAGTPVIASDLPVVREVVGTEPGTAALVPVGDVAALTAALRRQMDDGDPVGAAEARRRRAGLFDWASTAALTRAAYARAAGA